MSSDDERVKRIKDKVFDLFEKLIERLNPLDGLMWTGLAIAGLKAPLLRPLPVWTRMMIGPLGYELAKVPSTGGNIGLGIGGATFPVNSQVAGLTMLGLLGFSTLPWEKIGDKIQDIVVPPTIDDANRIDETYELTDEERAELTRLRLEVLKSTFWTIPEQERAMLELKQYILLLENKYEKSIEELEGS